MKSSNFRCGLGSSKRSFFLLAEKAAVVLVWRPVRPRAHTDFSVMSARIAALMPFATHDRHAKPSKPSVHLDERDGKGLRPPHKVHFTLLKVWQWISKAWKMTVDACYDDVAPSSLSLSVALHSTLTSATFSTHLLWKVCCGLSSVQVIRQWWRERYLAWTFKPCVCVCVCKHLI